jgi:hypothetical protein
MSTKLLTARAGRASHIQSGRLLAGLAEFLEPRLFLSATHLVFKSGTPADGIAGLDISPDIVVKVENANNKLADSAKGEVTLSIATGPGAILGTDTVKINDGKAKFAAVDFDVAGAYTLTATSGTLASATSSSFTISPAAAAKLAFASDIVSPQTAGSDIAPPIVVDVEDAFGNLVTTSTVGVKLKINSGGDQSVLGGTLRVHAVDGVATFSDVTISTPGTFTLKAKHEGMVEAVTNDPAGLTLSGNSTGSNADSTQGSTPAAVKISGNGVGTIIPGVYSQITVSGNGQLTLEPGLYAISGGGITINGNGSITGNGVTIYAINGADGSPTLHGKNAQFNVSPGFVSAPPATTLAPAVSNSFSVLAPTPT